jgi:hypothetical protein
MDGTGSGQLSMLFDSPPTAAKGEKEFFGDTPNPGKGLRSLHSYVSKERWRAFPNPGKGLCPLHSQKVSGKEINLRGARTYQANKSSHISGFNNAYESNGSVLYSMH